MSLALAVLLLSGVANLLLGGLIMLRNPKSSVSRLFLLLSLSVSSWTFTNYLTEVHFENLVFNDIFNRLAYFTGALSVVTILLFSYSFQKGVIPKMSKLFWLLTCAVLALSVTDLVAGHVSVVDGNLQFSLAPLLPLFIIAMLGYIVMWVVHLIKTIRSTKGYTHAQAKLILFGVSVSVLAATVTNLVIPLFADSYTTAKFGPLFTMFFVYSTGYAVIRYRLFDVRMAITRFVGYAVTILITASLYSFIILLFNSWLLNLDHVTAKQLVVLVIPTIFVALTFNKVAVVIAHSTQRIFYQDAYDIRDVLDQLSDTLLAENDISEIMSRSLAVLSGAIKPSSAYFVVLNTSGVAYKQLETGDQHVTDLAPFLLRLRKERDVLIDREEAPNRPIAKLMAKQDIELLLRVGTKEAPIGLLLLGVKRNGSMYTKQDIALLRISAKNLGIALDNAKKYEQIIHFADTLHKEVDQATSRLRKANQELKTLDALKDDFISTASHQLRSPAVSVHDALHMLNYPNMTKKEREELLVLAEGSSERLVTVVRTLLNMARIKAGHFTIDRSEADVVDLIDRELEQLAVLAKQKSITVVFEKPDHEVKANVDVAKLTEAVANYVENAIKYSLEKTTITIVLNDEDEKIRLEVFDQGMGVPPQERKDLFGHFYRASNARQEQPDGNGIGLYVAKMIAEGHGGEAYYRPGTRTGSVFGLWIKKV